MHPGSEKSKPLTYQKALHISWKKPENCEKTIILKLIDGDFYSLEDPVSIQIWEQLMIGMTVADIIRNLTEKFPAENPVAIAQDTEGFIAELLEEKIICPCP